MKLHPILAVALAVFVAPAAVHAASFEGSVRMKMSQPKGEAFEMTYRMKGGLMRTEMQTGNGSMATIMDLGKKEMIVLMPEQQMYMVHSLAAAGAAVEKQASDVTFEKTGDTEKILGYDCTKYISKSKDGISDVWVTEQLGSFAGLGGMAGGGKGGKGKAQTSGWEKALMGKDLFPLRVVVKNQKGAEQFRMEVVAVDKGPQPAELFAPPAGYQKFDMGGMMRGMLPGGKR
ncbi:DUF4412 domain-containing protein [Opitutus terrae]|uniref:DUF4412 domain-containing protein n=1 Tax=Opitutus terrae (strain DSM 11246 / JCM 15787 / PB90-1) TaxID=452637 RepID=B1ZS63_OPITP|nr:DUF4412 domain-containing protein [Opitutus terrae]ACB75662.1 hypothetical protein Oter_2380 [Opitutus terrae PB90-1]